MPEDWPGQLDWPGQEIATGPSGASASLAQTMPSAPVQGFMAGVAEPFLKAGDYLGGIMQGSQQFNWPETVQHVGALGMAMAPGPKGERVAAGVERGLARLPALHELHGPVASEPGYVYHATNAERAQEIAESGSLGLHKPHEFTDQSVWPDGSVQKRNYFSPSAENSWQFAPEEGKGALLRIKKDEHHFKQEKGTGDLYSNQAVPASKIEALDASGNWVPLQGAAAEATPGIRAYHSSPHDFNQFDINKIGAGQGAQSYGHGLYFAENPEVSGQGGEYWREFSRNFKGPESSALIYLENAGFDRAKARQLHSQMMENNQRWLDDPNTKLSTAERSDMKELQKHREETQNLLDSDKPIGPRTYEVNIKAHPEQFIDWDKPLGEQDPKVRPLLTEAIKKEAYNRALSATHQARADELWNMVKDPNKAPAGFAQELLKKPEFVQQLREAGIPGIRYLDQGSRTPTIPTSQQHLYKPWGGELDVPKPTSNYVVFNDKLVDIVKKYGIAGLIAAGAYHAQDNQ